ncbi:MAG: hypothetical protein ACRDXX_14435 [Stackebrandtia sp.]
MIGSPRATSLVRPSGSPGCDAIDRHVAELASILDGPWLAKAGMLREVRDGLRDAASAYEDEGREPAEAAARATEDFGAPREVAGDYQVELAACQTRNALAFAAVLGPLGEVLSRIWWSNSAPPASPPSQSALTLASAVDVSSWVLSGVAVAGLLAVGVGARWLTFRAYVARLVGVGLFAKTAALVVCGVALQALFNGPVVFDGQNAMAFVNGMFYMVSCGCMFWFAWRCVRVARGVPAPANR